MAGNSSRRGTGAGASGAGFRRTGTQPGAARRGAFIVYTDTPDNMIATVFRLRWKLALVATVFLIIGVAIYLMQLGTDNAIDAELIPKDNVNETKEAAKFVPPAIVVDFLRASSLAEKLRFVRDPSAMANHIASFYGDNPNRPERYNTIAPVNDVNPAPGIEKFYVTSDGDQRIAAVVDTPDGKKIDWPAYARLNDVDWDTFRNGNGNGNGKASRSPAFRVQITELDYYSGEFSDPHKYKCFQISSPELYRDLFGYAERGSATEQELSAFSAPVKQRCILQLATPASPDALQIKIMELVTQDWVLP
ncbi:MAG: hypothetical protein O3C21_10780 [Verrucomicrobia bacterium]|nr:hypothetical protein [Verrucomicrobiota bacterium]